MERLNLNSKWVSTVASIWIQCTSGSLYTFSTYSPSLKSTQGYDQSTLDTGSVFKDIGANCGILSGVLYSYTTSDQTRVRGGGPWVVILVGAIQSFAGYFLMWAAVDELIRRPPVAVMYLFMLLASHGQSFFNTSDVVTSVRNFPQFSGAAVGIMKGFLGLSGAILIQVYQTIFNDKPRLYLLMLALLTSINPLLLMWFVRIYEVNERDEKRYVDRFSLIALIVVAYFMSVVVLEHLFSFNFVVRVISFVLLLVLLLSPLFVAIKALENSRVVDGSKMLAGQDPVEYHQLPNVSEGDAENHEQCSLPMVRDLNLLQALRTVDFWILFPAMACGMGSGLVTVNNLSQVGGSLGYASLETNTLVSLWNIWIFLGRFGAGYISDYFIHMKGWARPLFMAITVAGMSIGYVVIASGLPGALYAGSILVGVCYGSQWSLLPTIASEIFGVRHMGTIFNTITIASPVGSFLFSVGVVGYIYDNEASREGNMCIGFHCFMLSFLIMACATLLGSSAAMGFSLGHEAIIIRLLSEDYGTL